MYFVWQGRHCFGVILRLGWNREGSCPPILRRAGASVDVEA